MRHEVHVSHHYETADQGEPVELDDTYRIVAYHHGDRVRYRFERLDPPIIVKRPGIGNLDKSLPTGEDAEDSTT